MTEVLTAVASAVAEPTVRSLRYFEAIREALDYSLAVDPKVYLMGLGVPDPKGIFGTTLGLATKYGEHRIMDMPTAENGMTGVAIGSTLTGMRPVMVHQRLDFVLLAMEQIVSQAANWHYMYGGCMPMPIVIRLVVGRGWGQGPQHSQSLHSWFAHIPGLKVIAPATAHDAKGLLLSAIKDNNPVIVIEHRWCHNLLGAVPEEAYFVEIGKARIARQGNDATIVGVSHMTVEALQAAENLARIGVSAEVVDLRSIRPLDIDTVLQSVSKTGRLVVADTDWVNVGISAEILARVFESGTQLKSAPRRFGLPESPSPCSPALSREFYPRWEDLANAVLEMLQHPHRFEKTVAGFGDVPDPSFTGPF